MMDKLVFFKKVSSNNFCDTFKTKFFKTKSFKIKSQSSFEFLIILFIVIIFFMLLISFLNKRIEDFNSQSFQYSLQEVGSLIEKEILVARNINGNYERKFSLPNLQKEYSIKIIKGKELVITSKDAEYIKFLPYYIYEEFGYFDIKTLDDHSLYLIKKGPQLGLCPCKAGVCSCDVDSLFNVDGFLQCESAKNYWQECKFNYDDEIKNMRYQSNINCNLRVRAEDDNYEVLFSHGVKNDDFIEFKDLNLIINESGIWSFEVICEGNSLINYYEIPYGYFEFYPLKTGSECRLIDGVNTCLLNKNFTLFGNLVCLGGECGDAKIWVDP